MTTARAQPLLVDSELTKAHDFLFEAHMLVTDVRSLFFNGDDFATAARLRDIQGRLADEIHAVEGLIAASEQEGAVPHVVRGQFAVSPDTITMATSNQRKCGLIFTSSTTPASFAPGRSTANHSLLMTILRDRQDVS